MTTEFEGIVAKARKENASRKVGWVLEADLKNFFGSLDHGWILRFIELRVGGARRGTLESSP